METIKYIEAAGMRVARVDDAGVHYYHKDHLGSTVAVTDELGENYKEYTLYKPYGRPWAHLGGEENKYRFTDKELDASTGLYDYGARLYDPLIGRFISADGVIPDFYDPQMLNRYAYARNNPLKYIDPNGHEPVFPEGVKAMQRGEPVNFRAMAARNAGRGMANLVHLALEDKVNVLSGKASAMDYATTAMDLIPGEILIKGLVVSAAGVVLKHGDEAADALKHSDNVEIFHRIESPTQTKEIAKLQEESGEIWGKARRDSDIPQVQAHNGPLPPSERGIEFKTTVPPDKGSAPWEARWTAENPNVIVEDDYAKIRVDITKNTQK